MRADESITCLDVVHVEDLITEVLKWHDKEFAFLGNPHVVDTRVLKAIARN